MTWRQYFLNTTRVLAFFVLLALPFGDNELLFSGPLFASAPDDEAEMQDDEISASGAFASQNFSVPGTRPNNLSDAEIEKYMMDLRSLEANRSDFLMMSPPSRVSAEVICPTGSFRRLRAFNFTPGKIRDRWRELVKQSPKIRERALDMTLRSLSFGHCKNRPPDAHPVKLKLNISSPRNPVKIILGLISATLHCSLRNAHRMSWFTYKHVCELKDYRDPRCEIFPVFVIANVSADTVESAPNFAFLHDVRSAKEASMDRGYSFKGQSDMWVESNLKTPKWFQYASTKYPWATHIGKLDLDTFPKINLIHEVISRVPVGQMYYGFAMSHGGGGGYKGTGGMYGELYMMSADLVRCIVPALQKRGEFGSIAEDQVVGNVVCSQLDCPDVNKIDVGGKTWFHGGHMKL